MHHSDLFHLHLRAQWVIAFYGTVAMAADSELGPRNLAQCWHDCEQVLMPLVCYGDALRQHIVWNGNWNRPRFDFINALARVYERRNY